MRKLLRRVLLTNDDGIESAGLAVLTEIVETIAAEVWVIAPQQDQSGMAQSISINAPLRGQKRGERRWSLGGTPSDCVVLALSHFMKKNPPTLILSGINGGANTGDDINLSGTLGAAFSGLMLGVPSVAVSLDCRSRNRIKWDTARAVLPDLLCQLAKKGWDKEHCLSINIPDLAPDKVGTLCWTRPAYRTIPSFRIEKREDLREKDYFWLYPHKDKTLAPKDSDVAALARGDISISALTLGRAAGKARA